MFPLAEKFLLPPTADTSAFTFKEGELEKKIGQIYCGQNSAEEWVMACVISRNKQEGERTLYALVSLETLNEVLNIKITHRAAIDKATALYIRIKKDNQQTFYQIPKALIPRRGYIVAG